MPYVDRGTDGKIFASYDTMQYRGQEFVNDVGVDDSYTEEHQYENEEGDKT
jgi:hypothetical protein